MKINIFCIGKIKEEYLRLGILEYLKRLSTYVNIEIIEVKDEAIFETMRYADIEKAKNIEGKRVLKLLKNDDYLIALDLSCKEMTSEELAIYIDKKMAIANSKINFVIGGSYGLSDELKKRANDKISLSKLTFLHTFTRLILLEQIYRSFKIIKGEVYHK